jgi:translation initiation factor 1 (eIF-1/SUI1)
MAKKDKTPEISAPLKHSPFARLGQAQSSAAPPLPGAEPVPTGEPAASAAGQARTAERAARTAGQARTAESAASAAGQAGTAEPSPSAGRTRSADHLSSQAAQAPTPGKSRGRLVQRRETKHRAGKAVVVVAGFEQLREFDEAAIAALAKELKQALGCGGTVESRGAAREIVLQGDRPAQVAELLRARGFRVDGVTR